MAGMTPEFSRPFRLDELGTAPRNVAIEADEAERAALAKRFGLISVDSLSAKADLTREGDIVLATGSLAAEVMQACVASGDPVPATVREGFALRFVPARADQADQNADEVELEEGDLDEIEYERSAIDLGEAAAQTLALALDPFPRAPGADERLREAGVIGEEDAGPFAALKALKDRI